MKEEHYLIINGQRLDITAETRDMVLAQAFGFSNAEEQAIELNETVIELVRDLVAGKPGAFQRGKTFLAAVDAVA